MKRKREVAAEWYQSKKKWVFHFLDRQIRWDGTMRHSEGSCAFGKDFLGTHTHTHRYSPNSIMQNTHTTHSRHTWRWESSWTGEGQLYYQLSVLQAWMISDTDFSLILPLWGFRQGSSVQQALKAWSHLSSTVLELLQITCCVLYQIVPCVCSRVQLCVFLRTV